MKVLLLLPLLLLVPVPLCAGWMRPRVGGMVRFGRSGDTWDDLEREAGHDDDDYGDYEEQIDILRDIVEKGEKRNIHPLQRTFKRNVHPCSRQGREMWPLCCRRGLETLS
eukprot:TRINITY_DN12528_c0_g1_i3.p1 TRINITY_DN12528_c0_g1~~TRINITY_DN12528_c0_g1_i3.p1  ORF type:complete len:110 (-),score=36.86 TRINITY_DN12528_c0_g1_i3:145-474(-)